MYKPGILKIDLHIEKIVIRRFFYFSSICLVILLALTLSLNYTRSLDQEYADKIKQLSSSIIEEKKRFLRNAVERTLFYIDQERETVKEEKAASSLSSDQIEAICIENISNYIRAMRLIDNGYIWVNRILDYNGGDNYAIRQIHPNLPSTEGEFLSTNTTDIKGNRPYEEELNGVMKDGELYYDYYFKKMDSDTISHKMSFAKLYKPLDWVVASGVYLDDVDMLIESELKEMQRSHSAQKFRSLITALFFVLISVVLIMYFETLLSRMIQDYENRIKQYTDNVLEEKAKAEKALAEVKELKGLLPICSSCKKIRDDQGYWKHIESYFKLHTDVDFSHGLCPDCTENLYGNEDWYRKRKQAKSP